MPIPSEAPSPCLLAAHRGAQAPAVWRRWKKEVGIHSWLAPALSQDWVQGKLVAGKSSRAAPLSLPDT